VFLDHRADSAGNTPLDGDGNHAAHGVGNLLHTILFDQTAHRIRNPLHAGLSDQVASRIAVHCLDMSSLFEHIARARVIVSRATRIVGIHISAGDGPHDRVGNLFLADFGLHAGHRIRNFLDAGLPDHPRNRARHSLDDRAGHCLANSYRHLLDHALPHVGRARNLLADRFAAPDLATADARRILANDFAADRRFVASPAGDRVETGFGREPFVEDLYRRRYAVLLRDPFAALADDRLVGRDRFADGANAFLAASLHDRLARGAAHFLDDALGDGPTNGAAHV